MTPDKNPIINPPYAPPSRHWELDDHGKATSNLVESRRPSAAYESVPIARRTRDRPRLVQETRENLTPHPRINRIRKVVTEWREAGYPGTNRATKQLLEYWAGEEIEQKPFFAQREAVETIVWLNEAGHRCNTAEHKKIVIELDEENATWSEGLPRQAIKMATGTGKTRVMAMLILWLALRNKNQRTDVLILAPNLTVKDRLEELDTRKNIREQRELYQGLLPAGQSMPGRLYVTISNFHQFQRRSTLAVAGPGDTPSGTEKALLGHHETVDFDAKKESPEGMLNRILKSHKSKRLWVFNDEAHHCYPRLNTERRTTPETREDAKNAGIWFGALKTLHDQNRLHSIFDLSATPMFLLQPVNYKGEIFPWTVSDYPLIDAAEAGLVKIPYVPTDDTSDEDEPIFRYIHKHTTPKTNFTATSIPARPAKLLDHLCRNYAKTFDGYANAGHTTPPVLAVVTHNIVTADAFYGYLAGRKEGNTWIPSKHDTFSNVNPDGTPRINAIRTLLVHSKMDDKLEKIAKLQSEFLLGADGEILKGQDLENKIREMFLTVGQDGAPGEQIRCIVSVSMLTEGWDARTVTDIFGFRAFGSQLLCEQVTGRALRRTSFGEVNPKTGLLSPEYARVFGVPFSFMNAGDAPPPPPRQQYLVKSIEDRKIYRIEFPNIVNYQIVAPSCHIELDPSRVKPFIPITSTIPSSTDMEPIVGKSKTEHPIGRNQSMLWELAKMASDKFCEINNRTNSRRLLFASMVQAVKDWLAHPAIKINDLGALKPPNPETAALAIAKCCKGIDTDKAIIPVFENELEPIKPRSIHTGTTRFWTGREHHYRENIKEILEKSELNIAACDSYSETEVAKVLDTHPAIHAWARNYQLGWRIPWLDRKTGDWHNYEPDFVASASGKTGPLRLVIEFKGITDDKATQKKEFAEEWWCKALNGQRKPEEPEWRYVFIQSRTQIRKAVDKALER